MYILQHLEICLLEVSRRLNRSICSILAVPITTTVYNIEISASCRCCSVVVVVVVVVANLEHFVLNAKSIERVDGGCSSVRCPVLNKAVTETLTCQQSQSQLNSHINTD